MPSGLRDDNPSVKVTTGHRHSPVSPRKLRSSAVVTVPTRPNVRPSLTFIPQRCHTTRGELVELLRTCRTSDPRRPAPAIGALRGR